MMLPDYETDRFVVYHDGLYGVGFIERKIDGAATLLITGSDMTELRRTLNRAKTNATSKRKLYRPFEEIADAILGEYFPILSSPCRDTTDGQGECREGATKASSKEDYSR